MKRKLLLLGFLTFSLISFSQTTTAAMRGVISDATNEPLAGASVQVLHVPSGTSYGSVTQFNGSYNIPNMRVGGPYTITVSYVGFKTETLENVQLKLGEKRKLNFSMQDDSAQLDEVVISATTKNSVINSGRTGASTSVGKETIEALPTISRSINDFTRLNPSSDGNSFGGGNNKMNNLSLDGSIFNNPFGLDGGTPGSQTNAQPISLDAIEQVQVQLAPYDVTSSGFTGASINAVTKSGTNDFHGSVFGFFRNEDFPGTKVKGNDIFQGKLEHLQAGFSLGGPIIENKLFFFANAEIERRDDLVTGFRPRESGETPGGNISRVLRSDLELVSTALGTIGYDTGGFENLTHATDNEKFIAKLDWNINENHTLTATYNQLDATRDKPAHPTAFFNRGPNQNTLQFENSSYSINNKIQSAIVELKSRFGNKLSNNLQVGYTHFDDFRTPFSTPGPSITISKGGSPYIIAGHEPFSVHNKLDQKVFQITNNFKIYSGNHTITLGGSFEKFEFDNSFNLTAYGFDLFGSVAIDNDVDTGFDYIDDVTGAFNPTAFQNFLVDRFGQAFTAAETAFNNNNDSDPDNGHWSLAETNVGQLAFYVQDEFAVTNDFTLTYGLRIDKPDFFDTADKVQENIDRDGFAYDPSIQYFDEDGNPTFYDSTKLPSEKKLLLSPRLGINWDIKGDNTQQLRGGLGVFTGRLPFVWIGNQVQNINSFFYTVVDKDFNFPQVFRSSLGYDRKFKNGFTTSFDVMYSKNIDAIFATNIGLNRPTGSLEGPGSRPIYTSGDITNNAWSVTNTNEGRVINFTTEVKKKFENGLALSFAYDYLDATDASSPTEEITNATFGANPAIGNVNKAVANNSRFGHKHRFVGSATKKFTYGNGKWATALATYFEATETGRFSYVYGGDINGDGSAQNDLIYIPTTSEINGMNFTGDATEQAAQRIALDNYIKQDDYLNDHRGDFSDRNANLSPWYTDVDVRLAQDYNISDTKKVQFTIDVLNFGNLLNSDWGVRQIPVTTQPIGVSVDPATSIPTYSFDTSLTETFTNDLSLLSRWQMQFGLRFVF